MCKITNQELFDKIYDHLVKQGEPALDGGRCRYRTEDGKSCAIGCLILDDEYYKNLENKTIDDHKVVFTLQRSLKCDLTDDNKNFLDYMQGVHDGISHLISCNLGISKDTPKKEEITDCLDQYKISYDDEQLNFLVNFTQKTRELRNE